MPRLSLLSFTPLNHFDNLTNRGKRLQNIVSYQGDLNAVTGGDSPLVGRSIVLAETGYLSFVLDNTKPGDIGASILGYIFTIVLQRAADYQPVSWDKLSRRCNVWRAFSRTNTAACSPCHGSRNWSPCLPWSRRWWVHKRRKKTQKRIIWNVLKGNVDHIQGGTI